MAMDLVDSEVPRVAENRENRRRQHSFSFLQELSSRRALIGILRETEPALSDLVASADDHMVKPGESFTQAEGSSFHLGMSEDDDELTVLSSVKGDESILSVASSASTGIRELQLLNKITLCEGKKEKDRFLCNELHRQATIWRHAADDFSSLLAKRQCKRGKRKTAVPSYVSTDRGRDKGDMKAESLHDTSIDCGPSVGVEGFAVAQVAELSPASVQACLQEVTKEELMMRRLQLQFHSGSHSEVSTTVRGLSSSGLSWVSSASPTPAIEHPEAELVSQEHLAVKHSEKQFMAPKQNECEEVEVAIATTNRPWPLRFDLLVIVTVFLLAALWPFLP